MTVIEIIKKYELEDYSKTYKNAYGVTRNFVPLDKLAATEVKDISINFPEKEVVITLRSLD